MAVQTLQSQTLDFCRSIPVSSKQESKIACLIDTNTARMANESISEAGSKPLKQKNLAQIQQMINEGFKVDA